MTTGVRSREFRLLWASESISMLGSRISLLAFPTVAILQLQSGAAAVGVLTALGSLPLLLLSMLSGTVADRGNRRRIAVGCELVGMVATGSVPLAYALGHLTLLQLFVVAVVNGAAGNLGNIAFYSIVPDVVAADEFDRASGRLEGSTVVAAVAGPGLGGALIQAVGAARAVTADTLSFLVSALLLVGLRRTPARRQTSGTSFRQDLVQGMRFVFGDRRLRRLALASAVANLGGGIAAAVLLIYLYRDVGLSPGGVGVIVMVTGALGALLAFNAPRICRRLGYARALAGSAAINGAGFLVLPLATHTAGVLIVVVSYLCQMVENGLWNVSMITLRRSFTPTVMFGRMVASTRTVAQGTLPLGSLIGGLIGARFGVVPALLAGGVLMAACGLLVIDAELLQIRAPRSPEAEVAASAS